MNLTRLDLIFWAAGFAGHIALLCLFFYRKRTGDFPWFTGLIAQDVLQTIVLYTLHTLGYATTYFYTYWAMELLNVGLGFLVLLELARNIGAQTRSGRGETVLPIVKMLGLMSPIALIILWFYVPGTNNHFADLAIKIGFASSFLLASLLAYQWGIGFFFSVRFRAHAMALTAGLAIYYGSSMLMYVLMVAEPAMMVPTGRMLKPVYLAALCFWGVVLWMDQPKRLLSADMHRVIYPELYRETHTLRRIMDKPGA